MLLHSCWFNKRTVRSRRDRGSLTHKCFVKVHACSTSSSTAKSKRLFCFGLGYAGFGFAQFLTRHGWSVSGTCRSAERLKWLHNQGVTPYTFDSSRDELSEELLHELADCKYILSTIAPGKSESSQSTDPVLAALGDHLSIPANAEWIGYLSSTGVYGDWGGGWVDESSQLRTKTRRGKVRVAAEQEWMSLCEQMNAPVSIFRLGGLYGPGRSVLHSLLTKGSDTVTQVRRREQRFVNRCHLYDVCQVLYASMAQPDFTTIFNVVDDNPACRSDVEEYAKELLKTDPERVLFASAVGRKRVVVEKKQRPGPDRSHLQHLEEKRVRNLMIKDLGVELAYPTFREGLDAIWNGDVRPFL